MRTAKTLLLLLFLVSCSPRANVAVVTSAPGVGSEIPIHLGTTRAKETDTTFASDVRSPLSFTRYVISAPPEHEPGVVTVAGRTPDPIADFVTRDVTTFDDVGFRRFLSREMQSAGTREAAVFVDGFNNTLADGVYRLAQIKNDLDLRSVAVHYAWPSGENPLGYVRDRDSALYGRAGLADFLDEVAGAGARELILVAHSMGAFITMEKLIWMRQQGRRSTLHRIRAVVLLSPDIDVDHFQAQAEVTGDLPQPLFIFASSRDLELRLSARLSRERDRLGRLIDISRVAYFDVALIDLSSVNATASWHLATVSSPAMLELLGQAARVDDAFDTDPSARAGLLPGTIQSGQSATAVIVTPP